MNFYILTLFPEMIEDSLSHSILGRAQKNEKINIEPINIRDFADNRQKQVDDYPYGGGVGMVMQAEPIYKAYKSINKQDAKVIYLTPQGKIFNQGIAKELSQENDIIFLCGHYEGVDERVIEEIVDEEISIGDFILTGGEIAAIAIIDAVSRLIPGVLGKDESFMNESFTDNLLEYPQYTRPFNFLGRNVPKVLLSGHHREVEKWRREKSIERTIKKRPDLLKDAVLTADEKKYIENYKLNFNG